jgi:hypothetical protein
MEDDDHDEKDDGGGQWQKVMPRRAAIAGGAKASGDNELSPRRSVRLRSLTQSPTAFALLATDVPPPNTSKTTAPEAHSGQTDGAPETEIVDGTAPGAEDAEGSEASSALTEDALDVQEVVRTTTSHKKKSETNPRAGSSCCGEDLARQETGRAGAHRDQRQRQGAR